MNTRPWKERLRVAFADVKRELPFAKKIAQPVYSRIHQRISGFGCHSVKPLSQCKGSRWNCKTPTFGRFGTDGLLSVVLNDDWRSAKHAADDEPGCITGSSAISDLVCTEKIDVQE